MKLAKLVFSTFIFGAGALILAGCLNFANSSQSNVQAATQTLPPKPQEKQDQALIYPGTYRSGSTTLVLKRLKAGEYSIEMSVKSDGIHPVADFADTGYQINNEIVFPVSLITSESESDKEIELRNSYYLLRQLSPKKVEWEEHMEPLPQNAVHPALFRGRSAEDQTGVYTRK